GIRDRNVTGVQTCALPIYPARCRDQILYVLEKCLSPGPVWAVVETVQLDALATQDFCQLIAQGRLSRARDSSYRDALRSPGDPRSEERRVGKGAGARRAAE